MRKIYLNNTSSFPRECYVSVSWGWANWGGRPPWNPSNITAQWCWKCLREFGPHCNANCQFLGQSRWKFFRPKKRLLVPLIRIRISLAKIRLDCHLSALWGTINDPPRTIGTPLQYGDDRFFRRVCPSFPVRECASLGIIGGNVKLWLHMIQSFS